MMLPNLGEKLNINGFNLPHTPLCCKGHHDNTGHIRLFVLSSDQQLTHRITVKMLRKREHACNCKDVSVPSSR